MGLLAWARWTSGEILGRMDFRRDIGPNGLLAVKCDFWRVFQKGYAFGPNGFFLACVENLGFCGLCALGMFHASCMSFMCFYLVVFGFYLPAVPFVVP